ncbi:MAG: hypothetical protein WED07_00025 [Candidatus Freyarchaeum deiterrae]
MTKRQILLLLTLSSLSLLVITPLAGSALAYSNSANLLPTAISAAQTPESIPTMQTWAYQATYRNSTPYTGSFTYTQQNSGIIPIVDWNGSTQQCYDFITTVDIIQMARSLGVDLSDLNLSNDVTSATQLLYSYINTTNYSIPRADTLLNVGFSNGTSAKIFGSALFNITVYLYKFPLSGSWQNIANASLTGWAIDALGNNYSSSSWIVGNISASVLGLTSVTVPAGSYQAYQINYTNNNVAYLFFGILGTLVAPYLGSMQVWYSLAAQNFVKYFMDLGSSSNVTIELLSIYNPIQIMLFSTFYNSWQQQQGSFRLLLVGGGITAAIAIAVIAIVLHRRAG